MCDKKVAPQHGACIIEATPLSERNQTLYALTHWLREFLGIKLRLTLSAVKKVHYTISVVSHANLLDRPLLHGLFI